MNKQSRWTGDRGATLVEYALLLALIAVVSIGAVAFVGHQAKSTLEDPALVTSLGGTSAPTTVAPTTTVRSGNGGNNGGNNG